MPRPGTVGFNTVLTHGMTKRRMAAKARTAKKVRPMSRPGAKAMKALATRPSNAPRGHSRGLTTKVEMDNPDPRRQETPRPWVRS